MIWGKKQQVSEASKGATKEEIDIIFQSLWQRQPTGAEMQANLSRDISEIILEIRSSPTFAEHLPNLMRPYTLRFGSPHIADTDEFYRNLLKSPLRPDDLDEIIMKKFDAGPYYDFHKERFRELHGFIAHLNRERPVTKFLEISTMPYTTGIWKEYLPNLNHLVTIDLPSPQGGPDPSSVLGFGSDTHLSTDLNVVDLQKLRDDATSNGKFDVIIATEVVEHLQRDFSEIAAFFLSCLAPRGVVIVTTPNAVSEMSLLFIFNGRNPYQRFVNYNANKGGHMHFREYTMAEMLEDVQKVGASLTCPRQFGPFLAGIFQL